MHPHRQLRLVRGGQHDRPSMPAVARPALSSVTRRTLNSAFDRVRSINFCRLRTRFRSPACDAVKIRCRNRRTSSSMVRQSIGVPVQAVVLRSVHVPRRRQRGASVPSSCPTCPSVPASSPGRRHRLTCPRQHPFGSGHQPVSGQLSGTSSGGGRSSVPVSCCLSATGIRFLGRPVPARDSAFLTVGLPARQQLSGRTPTGFPRSTRTRYDRGGCPLYPGTAVLPRPTPNPRPAPAASQRPVLHPAADIPSAGARRNEASTGVHSRSPVRSSPRL